MPTTSTPNLLLPSFALKIGGSPLPIETEIQVISITVEDDLTLPSMFTVELTGLETQNSQISLLDDALFALGTEVEVKLGYGGQVATLIKGEITGLEPEFTINRLPSLIVRGYDRRHRLQRGRKTRTFLQKKDSDIAAQIASEGGLTAKAEDSQVTHDYIMQANQTDLEFLQARARQLQYEVVVEDKTLLFRPVGNASSAVLTLTLEDNLLEFSPRLSSLGQVNQVSVRGWSAKYKQKVLGQAKAGDEVSTMGGQSSGAKLSESAFGEGIGGISDRPVASQAEADQFAKAQFNRGVLGLITGEGICRGNTQVRAGKVIEIDGIGERFSGLYYVTAASHRYGPRGYFTYFTVRRNAI